MNAASYPVESTTERIKATMTPATNMAVLALRGRGIPRNRTNAADGGNGPTMTADP